MREHKFETGRASGVTLRELDRSVCERCACVMPRAMVPQLYQLSSLPIYDERSGLLLGGWEKRNVHQIASDG